MVDVAADPSVLDALDAQPEFVTPIWDYLAALVDEERIADGRRRLREQADVLRAVQARYGVDAETVVAVWGVESDYGRVFGKRALLPSLATLSCAGRRQSYFRGELFEGSEVAQQGSRGDAFAHRVKRGILQHDGPHAIGKGGCDVRGRHRAQRVAVEDDRCTGLRPQEFGDVGRVVGHQIAGRPVGPAVPPVIDELQTPRGGLVSIGQLSRAA